MSLDSFIESWTPYDYNGLAINNSLNSRWTNSRIANGGFNATGGPNGNPTLTIGWGSNLSKTLTHSNKWVFGIRYKTGNLENAGGPVVFLSNNGQFLFSFNVNIDGTISLYGASNIIGTTNAPWFSSNNWTFAECIVTFSGTTNILVTADLYVNGNYSAPLISGSILTGINKSNLLSNSATTNVITLNSGLNGPGSGTIDGSFYIHNGGGAIPGVWGDGKILRILPNGDTAQADWTPNSGTTHYNRINELPKDDDTTYLSAGTVSNKDSWDWEDIPAFSGVIRDVQISIAARKDDEGSKAYRIGVGATLTEAQSADFYINDSYYYNHIGWDLDPATGLAWTRAGFNAKQFGVELRA